MEKKRIYVNDNLYDAFSALVTKDSGTRIIT